MTNGLPVQSTLRDDAQWKAPVPVVLDDQRIGAFIRTGLKSKRVQTCLDPSSTTTTTATTSTSNGASVSTAATTPAPPPRASNLYRLAQVDSQSLEALVGSLSSVCARIFAAPAELCSSRDLTIRSIAVLAQGLESDCIVPSLLLPGEKVRCGSTTSDSRARLTRCLACRS